MWVLVFTTNSRSVIRVSGTRGNILYEGVYGGDVLLRLEHTTEHHQPPETADPQPANTAEGKLLTWSGLGYDDDVYRVRSIVRPSGAGMLLLFCYYGNQLCNTCRLYLTVIMKKCQLHCKCVKEDSQ